MAAINVHVGTQAKVDREGDSCAIRSSDHLGAPRSCIPELSATHNGQTKMVWIRRTLEDLLKDRKFRIAEGREIGKEGVDEVRLYLVIDRPFRQNDIPWMPAATEEIGAFGLIGEARKMACPTWDLPAGSPVIGGACPGATAGQSSVPVQIRKKSEAAVGAPVRLQETICQICYAEGGQYASPHVQAGEILRYWWCRTLIEGGQREEWIRTVVRAIQGERFPVERQGVLPMRIHSSGDFFSHAYAEAWIEVANRVPQVTFWAPTRTWAAPGWMDAWRRMLKQLKHGNLILRPSAYHTDDAAPSKHDHPWSGDFPFTAEGTTAIYKFSDAGQGKDRRYDWSCHTYAILDEAHSCSNAKAPDGKIGCRACWARPDLRVNYTAH